MPAQLLWWTPNVLEGLVLIRAVRGRLFRRFPAFYGYLSYVFLESNLRFCVYFFRPASYPKFYWYTQFLSVSVGCAVIWEIFSQALNRYPGAARLAKHVLAAIFAVVMGNTFIKALSGPVWSPARTTPELERNLRTVQAILLLAIIGLLAYYAIPAGRNLKGIILGYGFFIGASIVNLTLLSHLGAPFLPLWRYLPPATYTVTLLIWCFTLWSYQPNPQPDFEVGIERDYELFAARMSGLLVQMRTLLVKAIRP